MFTALSWYNEQKAVTEMDRMIEQIKELAMQHRAARLVLFGSRARGDCHARSDYDFAIWGMDPHNRILFQDAVENDLDTLYSIDLVFVDEHTDTALLASIKKDGIILMDRYQTKYENYAHAVARLREGIAAYQNDPQKIIRDGVIQRFEFTCELAWKTTREFLLEQNFTELNSPKSTMRQAFAYGLIDDETAWIELLNARNQTSHIYDDTTAQQISDRIAGQYILLLEKLLDKLKME